MFQRTARTLLVLAVASALLPGCGEPSSPPVSPPGTPTGSPSSKVRPVEGQIVTIPTENSAQSLNGTLYGKNQVAVIFSNMGAHRQETWGAFVQDLAGRGYMVLTYNMRYWTSDTAIDGSLREKAADDLRAAIAYARSQGATTLVLVGASLGGIATAKVAAAENPAAVVIMAAPMSTTELDIRVEESEVKGITAPKLFIYSQDEAAYISDGTQQMYDLAPEPKEIHSYPGSAHGTELFETEHRSDLVMRLLAFIEGNASVTP